MIHLWSEPLPASGGVTAQGVKNALGRPRMGLPTLLVRETVQNSWDAGAAPESRPILYSIDGLNLSGQPLKALRAAVFRELPPRGLCLDEVLARDQVPVVIISDRGTTGLGGPTRAGVQTQEPTDFADFIRNVGQPPDKQHGGGTYGYGKAVLFLASQACTILAYTRCNYEGRLQSRLIGMGLGDPFAAPINGRERLHTGRHYWGQCDPEAGVEPLLGEQADRIAALVGMPGFSPGERGTSIMIIGAAFGDSDLEAAVSEMSEALVWQCWPKMLGATPEMQFSVTYDGATIPVSNPWESRDLRPFIDAYRVALGHEASHAIGASHELIESLSPKQELGHLGIAKVIWSRPEEDERAGRPFVGAPHHVALMRTPRLVVTYLPGPESPVQGTAWAGAFIALDEVDRAFARAEPPTHDDWVVDILPRSREKTYVNVALRRIRETLRLFSQPAPPQGEASGVMPMAGLASALGGVLAGNPGPGAGVLPNPGPVQRKHRGNGGDPAAGRSRRRAPKLEVLQSRLVADDGVRALRIDLSVEASTDGKTTVRAVPQVAVNDGTSMEREEPVGAVRPRVIRWIVGDQEQRTGALLISGPDPVRAAVLVSVPEDTTVAVSFEVQVEMQAEGA